MKDTLHIYIRVSTAVQTEGTSLKTQERIGIKLANQLDLTYEIHNEGGRSSANDNLNNRPIMLNLLRLMDAGKVKHLYVYNTDRISRNQITWYTIRQKMIANKVTLYTPKGVHDANDSMENMILGIMNEIAVYDNQTRADRSRIGKFEKVKMNYWQGGDPPFGFFIQKMEGGSKLSVHPEESKWIRYIFTAYIEELSIKHIKAHLEENKVLTRRGNKHWSLGSLQAILRNEIYTGINRYHDKKYNQTIIGKVPQIISSKIYSEASERRAIILKRKGQINRTKKFYLL